MQSGTALSLLKDGELCLVVTNRGELHARWSASAWCFFYLDRGTPIVFAPDQIQEWRPVSRQ